MKIRLFSLVILTIILTFTHPYPVLAQDNPPKDKDPQTENQTPLDQLFSAAGNSELSGFLFGEQRPPCTPVNTYVKGRYSNIPPKEDCSMYGFDLFAKNLSKMHMTRGDPVVFEFWKKGPLVYPEGTELDFEDSRYTAYAGGMTGISLGQTLRQNATPIWQRLNEMASLFSNLKSDHLQEPRYDDLGINELFTNKGQQIKERIEYCKWLQECMNNNDYDLPFITSGNVERRCVNPQPIDGYCTDPNQEDIINEAEICAQSLPIFLKYGDRPLQGLKDPAFDETLNRRFFCMEPTIKAGELIVVCTNKDIGVENKEIVPTYISFLGETANKVKRAFCPDCYFACQEAFIPPGIVAAVQGSLNFTKNISSKPQQAKLEVAMAPLNNRIMGVEGPVVWYKPNIVSSAIAAVKGKAAFQWRTMQYASLINGLEMGCQDEQDAESYGENNPEDFNAGGVIQKDNEAYVKEPNAGQEGYQGDCTYVIGPPEFLIGIDKVIHESDVSTTKQLNPYQTFQVEEGTKKTLVQAEHPFTPTGYFETEVECEEEPDPDNPGQVRCVPGTETQWLGGVDGDVFNTASGTQPRYFALETLKKTYTPYNDPSHARNYKCDWYAYVRGLEPGPGCEGGPPTPNDRSRGDTVDACETPPFSPQPEYNIDTLPGPVRDAFLAAAAKYKIPVELLTAIAYIEGSAMWNLSPSDALALTQPWPANPTALQERASKAGLNCSFNFASAKGPMQMTPGAFDPHKNASGNANPNICNITDAVFAAAEFLVQDRLPIYGYPAGSGWDNPRKLCAAAQTYYGSCLPDQYTCRLGNNYCDFTLSYMGRQELGATTCQELLE